MDIDSTRMHSSRMRPASSLTIWGGVCPGGGCPGVVAQGVSARGVSAKVVSAQEGCLPEGVCLRVSAQEGCLPRRGVCPGGVSAQGGDW